MLTQHHMASPWVLGPWAAPAFGVWVGEMGSYWLSLTALLGVVMETAVATAPFCLFHVNKQPHYFAESILENHQAHGFIVAQINEERLWGYFY